MTNQETTREPGALSIVFNPITLKESNMNNYWLHRISHCAEVSYPLLERGILSTGWSDFSAEEFIEKTRKNGAYLDQRFLEEWGVLPRNRFSLWRFISEMKKGDLVIVPGPGVFSIYEIAEDLPFSIEKLDTTDLKDWSGNRIVSDEGLRHQGDMTKEGAIDLGFFRKVNCVHQNIPRSEYADQALTSRMKIRPTNANISDLAINVQDAIESYGRRRPINLYAQILEKTSSQVVVLPVNQVVN
jgi:hypothetical protein